MPDVSLEVHFGTLKIRIRPVEPVPECEEAETSVESARGNVSRLSKRGTC